MQETQELFSVQPDFVLGEEDQTAALFDEQEPSKPKEKEADKPAELALKDEAETEVPDGPTEAEKLEMLNIFDTLLFEGKYEERVQVGRKYHAVFQTRSAAEDLTISSRLDAMKFETLLAYQNQSSLLTLAYSLAEWNGEDYRDMKVKDRYKVVSDLPSQTVVVLSDALGKFDAKVMAAVQYGQENF